MVFVFDIDDTICDTDSYSEKYIENFIRAYNLPYKKVRDITRYAEEKFDWDKKTAILWNKTYGDEMLLNCPCKEGVKETINSLYDGGHTIIFATARSINWHANPEEITKNWLFNNGIKYHKLIIEREDKEVICREEGANIFVDDDLKITASVALYNPSTRVFLMSSMFNSGKGEPQGVSRIKSLREIAGTTFAENEIMEL